MVAAAVNERASLANHDACACNNDGASGMGGVAAVAAGVAKPWF